MGNQPVTIYASTVLVMWIILGLIVLLIFAVALVQWYYHKELNIIYAQQDVVGNELSNAWRKLHKHIMVQEDTLYKKDNCLKCGAYVII
jgi:beta-lactamase regulating signal transducer with metallopeptidase domain